MNSPILASLLSVFIVSAVSLIGMTTFVLSEHLIRRLLLTFIAFSTGALLGDVFIHIFPEMAVQSSEITTQFLLVLAGILLSFVIEKGVHWRHCHCSALPERSGHIHPVGIMNLVGDGLHNFIDGALIAGSYLISPQIGIATTIAVLLHEIPQEIGDFAILLFSGFSVRRALLLNFFTACIAFLGATIVLFSARSVPFLEWVLLPLAAGNFLYLAGSDLIPELHKESRPSYAFFQLVTILVGVGVMQLLKLLSL
ncbi:MAG: ZIP family metal transporter [Candidatus Peribacteraceae bacterium]|nr:ZIP family metal transporter [Candidatus Peribacteraceae bacterium]MDD5740295.1 ZIP family metal transporter [Candidatus Peribacteraceae bacterium]